LLLLLLLLFQLIRLDFTARPYLYR